MLILPKTIIPLVLPFRPVFSKSTWLKAQVLVVGAILSLGERTVTAALRMGGLTPGKQAASAAQQERLASITRKKQIDKLRAEKKQDA